MKTALVSIPYNPASPVYIQDHQKNSKAFHQHTGLEFIWLLNGNIRVTMEQIDYHLMENDLILINHFDMHRIVSESKDVSFIQVHLDSLMLTQYIPNFHQQFYDVKSFNNSRNNQGPYDIIRALLSNLIKQNDIFHTFYQLLDYLSSRFSKKLDTSRLQNKESNRIQKILNKIDNDFKTRLTLSSIAKESHYNASYLSDLFKKQVGISFKNYLEETRIRYSLFLLLNKDSSITNVALDSGFLDDKSYYKAIKRKYGMTPTEVRTFYSTNKTNSNSFTNEKIDYYSSFPIQPNVIENKIVRDEVFANVQIYDERRKQTWNKIINIGSANTLLNQNVRNQVKEIQREIRFEYIRFEGIFNQEMEVVQQNLEGITFNWKFVNDILDFLLSINTKPFISLSYMPVQFASSDSSFFNYEGNTSPPKEMNQWLSLVQSFLMNCINRYGHEVVSQWYFQVWTEFPINGVHWNGTLNQLFELYKQTALLIKGISPSLKVGPAAENFYTNDHISEQLLRFCKKYEVPVDFYCCNIYHNQVNIQRLEDINPSPKTIKEFSFQYEKRNHTSRLIEQQSKMLKSLGREDTELIVTRWNFSWDVTNSLHDTAFMATFIMDNLLHPTTAKVDAIGYLSASDILYEWNIDNTPFYGGSGLINTEGVKKSSYYAFVFLSKLGNTIISQGKNYIITKHGETIQILAYNSTYPNQAYLEGKSSNVTPYEVFEETDDLLLEVNLSNMYGTYKYKRYSLNQEHGSSYDEWIRMGQYPDLNNEETTYLKNKSYPSLEIKQLTFEGKAHFSIFVPVHGVVCILLNKQYN